ncbi:hypothetical protein HID58_047173 [Brassica napus]|uniref:DNA-directed RNA polymerase n=1 Tax=Brassica napus TaxID=3708 RepID=A0ABQ8AYH4_BRANA|nr:hypothetical protein HID58_047173 [Brassica napus]
MGYIKLTCPVTHVWYLKRLPSYIANLLDKPLKELEGLVYCDAHNEKTYFLTITRFRYISKSRNFYWGGCYPRQLADLDLRIIIENSLVEWKQLGEEGPTGNEWEDQKIVRRKDFLVRRMELAKHFI